MATETDKDRKRAEALAAQTRQAAADTNERSINSARRLLEVEQILARSKARIFALEEELELRAEGLETIRQRAERADRVMAAMKASLSWRITAPLRAVKRRG